MTYVDGEMITGKLVWVDRYSFGVLSGLYGEQMVYKHAVKTLGLSKMGGEA